MSVSERPKCHACAVPIHRDSEYPHRGNAYHVPCLVRSLQGEVDAISQRYEELRPHVKDRSVLRGLCWFADVAEDNGQHTVDEDAVAALEWLRTAAGRKPDGGAACGAVDRSGETDPLT